MKKIIIVLFGIFFSTLLFGQKERYYQQQVNYKMNIDVNASSFTYKGNQTIEYINNSPDELYEVYFHLCWNAPTHFISNKESVEGNYGLSENKSEKTISHFETLPERKRGKQNIHWIRQNGKDLKFEIQEAVMKVYLNYPIKPRSKAVFTMSWDAVIPHQNGQNAENNKEEINLFMTQWYPKIAEYDYEGWAIFDRIGRDFYAPFADFEVNIRIDKDFIIGGGGMLQNPKEVKGYVDNPTVIVDHEGKVEWRWKAEKILDFIWAANTEFSVETENVPDGPKLFFVYKKNRGISDWEGSKPFVIKLFQIMNHNFGRYEYPSYSFIQGENEEMKYGMCTFVSSQEVDLRSLVKNMSQKIIRFWYQQILAEKTTKYSVNEGFIFYVEDFVMHQLFPPLENMPHPFVQNISRYINFIRKGRGRSERHLIEQHCDSDISCRLFSEIKKELYLVQLGYIVGEEILSKILKNYYYEWAMKHPTDRDFLHIAQRKSGMDLKWFHYYWVHTDKVIDYAIKEVIEHGDSVIVTLINKGEIPMPIDFSLITKDGRIINYYIPLDIMRNPKTKDYIGEFNTLDYWNWTVKEYTFSLPYKKEELGLVGIDLSQRLADINPEDNIMEIQQIEIE